MSKPCNLLKVKLQRQPKRNYGTKILVYEKSIKNMAKDIPEVPLTVHA